MQTIRQGDLLFIPLQSETANSSHVNPYRAENFRPDGIIREGEATGHHHRIAVLDDAEVFRPQPNEWQGVTVVRVSERGVSIVHEEHKPVHLAPNTTYRVNIAREFDYAAQVTRPVWD